MASFEQHLTQLESVRLFEEGMKLSNACKQELEQAEGRIQVLVEGKGGRMQAAEMEVEEDEEVDESDEDETEADRQAR
jgi:exodeoxyribonuclease VII small subunit